MKSRKKNDNIILSPEALCGNGNAVARDEEGFVYFVKGGVPGDVIKGKIIKITKSYGVVNIEDFIEKSQMRTDDGCKFAPRCGGCVFQNISYESECEYKRKTIDDDLARIAGLDIRVSEFYPSAKICNYRNKAAYPVSEDKEGRMISGYYAPNSHRICEHDECSIGHPFFTKVRDFIIEYCSVNNISAYNEETGDGILRHIFTRCAADGSFVLTLVVNSDKFISDKIEFDFVGKLLTAFPECVSVCLNVNKGSTNAILGTKWRKLYGDGYLTDTLLGKTFRIAPASFYQVNREQAELLYSKAAELAQIKSGETILDLYCGTGTIGICLAMDGCKLYGVEITPEAVNDAKFNARANGVDAEFICLDAGEALNSERIKGLSPDVIILDPPRKGCGDEAVERIASFGSERIVYISCDPATLARDLKRFDELGYKAEKVVGVDMFPRTGHVESVVCLSREKADDCEDEPKMISDERSKYKSWSNLKKQMNDLLCDSLKDKISYFYTSYHEVHNAYGRATINYNKKEMVAFSWVEMYAQEREVSQLYQEGKKVSYGELEKGKWIPECKLCDADFINSLTIYLKTDIAISLHSDNYLLRVFAYMDRRVGKRTLIKIKDDVEKLPDWVKQFYRIRCEADGIVFPPKRITDESIVCLVK